MLCPTAKVASSAGWYFQYTLSNTNMAPAPTFSLQFATFPDYSALSYSSNQYSWLKSLEQLAGGVGWEVGHLYSVTEDPPRILTT